jgi:hypothetical protein
MLFQDAFVRFDTDCDGVVSTKACSPTFKKDLRNRTIFRGTEGRYLKGLSHDIEFKYFDKNS